MGTNIAVAFPQVQGAGANYVRLILSWRSVSPGSQPADPTDPTQYINWATFDSYVADAVAQNLTPLITVAKAPSWAEHRFSTDPSNWAAGAVRPDPVLYGQFAKAVATRYWTRYRLHFAWEAWNEPNLTYFLQPQKNPNGTWYSPGRYRKMLNHFYAGIHAVDPSATVVGGSTAPFGNKRKPGPLLFLRQVLCLSKTNHPVCTQKTYADAWSTHPYTQGGPTHHAASGNNVSLGDLARWHRAINAAVRYGHLRTSHPPVRAWVSEFGWDSKGPDPEGVPMWLHARWTSEALYRAWLAGVSVFIFHQLRDRPFPADAYQSGLYFCGLASLSDDGVSTNECEGTAFNFSSDVKKKSWTAARFPFVAFAANGRIKLWGRTPNSVGGQHVVIERKTSSGYRRLFTLTANSVGIFTKTWASSLSRGYLRARNGPAGPLTVSVPFSLVHVADRPASPWGCGGPIAC